MAAAEARAAWQRTANRCFVQEDAKRAPKLACCPSSSSSSTQQIDSGNDNATNEQEHPASNFVPLNWNPINSNLPPDTRWWLQLQPSFGSQKDFLSEHQLNASGDKLEERVESIVPTTKPMVSTAFMKQDFETRVDGMKTVTNVSQPPLKRKVDLEDYFLKDEEFMDWEPGERLISRKTEKISSELGSPWAGVNNCEPWWRISDQDELASLVAQKSLERIENCDLPRPAQSVPVSRIFLPSISCKSHTSMCDPFGYPHNSSTSGSLDEKYWPSGETGHLPKDTEKKLYSAIRTYEDLPENMPTSEMTDSSRDQLLEALRHSQTRAREAEEAAQKAYNEKEHIIKLFFRQASHLFAYKQWLHMLQLESLCLQLKMKEHQISNMLPVLPWMPLKGNKNSKEHKQKKCRICKYAVGFFVGLGLAGAGLLLGWTLGWLLPYL